MTKSTKTKVEFCKFLDSADKKGGIRLKPIGKAKNTVKKPALTGWKYLITDFGYQAIYSSL